MQNFFSYPLVVEEISSAESTYKLSANADNLAEIARILKVKSVKFFDALIHAKLNKKEHRLDVWGKVNAELELQSVISLDYFFKEYETDFSLFYDTKATAKEIKELELDFDEEAPDVVENGKIDLAEIAIEHIALVLEDYPRKPGETFSFVSEFDEETTEKMNPFSVLKKLKK